MPLSPLRCVKVTDSASAALVAMAWAYVALRILHSLIHLSYNHVIHRLMAFAASNLVLIVLWLLAAVHVFAHAPA